MLCALSYILHTNVGLLKAFNPWAPDSRSFLYVSSAGLTHVPLEEGTGQPCLGADRWQNQG